MIKVWSNVHCSFAANHLVQQLKRLGREAVIIPEWDPADDSLHILYQVSNKGFLPKNYILQQTEPWCSHWFNENYKNEIIPNAIAVWDYSTDNQKHYRHPKRAIVMPGTFQQPEVKKDIEYLFYGHIDGSVYRQAEVAKIQEKLGDKLKIVTNTCGPEMWEMLSRTKRVINIHYKPGSPMEMYRIHEAISFDCDIILHDEQQCYFEYHDNLNEVKHGLALAGV